MHNNFLHTADSIHELYTPDNVERIKAVALKAEKLGLKAQADIIFALYYEIRKSFTKAANVFKSIQPLIKTIELAEDAESTGNLFTEEYLLSAIRFEKAMPDTFQNPDAAASENISASIGSSPRNPRSKVLNSQTLNQTKNENTKQQKKDR